MLSTAISSRGRHAHTCRWWCGQLCLEIEPRRVSMWSSLTISHRLFASSVCVCAEVCAFRMPRRVLNYATAPRAYERESRAHMKAALDEQSRMHDANASLAKQDAAQLERTARAHAQHVERIVSEREELRKMQVGRRICQKQKKELRKMQAGRRLCAPKDAFASRLSGHFCEKHSGTSPDADASLTVSSFNLPQISLKSPSKLARFTIQTKHTMHISQCMT